MKDYPVGTWVTNGMYAIRVSNISTVWEDEWKEMLNPPDLTVKEETFYSNGKKFSSKRDADEYSKLYNMYFAAYTSAYHAQQALEQFVAKYSVKGGDMFAEKRGRSSICSY